MHLVFPFFFLPAYFTTHDYIRSKIFKSFTANQTFVIIHGICSRSDLLRDGDDLHNDLHYGMSVRDIRESYRGESNLLPPDKSVLPL